MPKRRDPKNDPRSAAFYESRRGDMSMWSSEPVHAKVETTGSVVVSIRMGVGEVEAVRRAASDYGMTVSDLVRSAILQTIHSPPPITVGPGAFTRSVVAGVVQSTDLHFVSARPCTAGTHRIGL